MSTYLAVVRAHKHKCIEKVPVSEVVSGLYWVEAGLMAC